MASTSFPNESDINVYASTDGGRTFTSVMDATPGAPTGTENAIKYDKPWLAVDNNPGPSYGTVYHTFNQTKAPIPVRRRSLSPICSQVRHGSLFRANPF